MCSSSSWREVRDFSHSRRRAHDFLGFQDWAVRFYAARLLGVKSRTLQHESKKSHSLWLQKAHWAFPRAPCAPLCSPGLCWTLLGSPGLCWALLGSPELPWTVLVSLVLSWALMVCRGLSCALLGSPGLPMSSPELSWALLGSPRLSSPGLCYAFPGSPGLS